MKSLLLRTGLILLFLFIFASVACTSSPKFSQGDIDKTEMAIRADFAKRGFTVEEVSLIKESDRQLSGFVKFRKSSGLLSNIQLSKNCIASMDADSGKQIWNCE